MNFIVSAGTVINLERAKAARETGAHGEGGREVVKQVRGKNGYRGNP